MVNFSFNKIYYKYILVFVILYLIFLLVNFPAKLIFSIVTLPENIKVSSVTGTIWSGKIKKLTVSSINVGSAAWRLLPERLFLGQLSANISLSNNKQYFNTNVIVSVLGEVELKNVQLSVESA